MNIHAAMFKAMIRNVAKDAWSVGFSSRIGNIIRQDSYGCKFVYLVWNFGLDRPRFTYLADL